MVPFPEMVFINNCLRFVPITIMIYDWALTLDDEVNLIWDRSSGVLKVLFLALRYGPIVPVSLAVFGFVPVSDRVYRIETDVNIAAMIFLLATVQVLLQIRIYIMYDKSPTILWTNAVLFVIEHCLTAFLSLYFGPRIIPNIPGAPLCHSCGVFPRAFALTYVLPLCYESYLVALAIRKSWAERDTFRPLAGDSALSILVRGSVQYFAFIASGMAISLVLFLAAPRFILWVDMLTNATASIGGARLILSLRKAFTEQDLLSHGVTEMMVIARANYEGHFSSDVDDCATFSLREV